MSTTVYSNLVTSYNEDTYIHIPLYKIAICSYITVFGSHIYIAIMLGGENFTAM